MLDVIKKAVWAAADKRRANMAAEYKHLLLGLIFLKYVSETFAARRAELIRLFADEADECLLHDCDEELPGEKLEGRDYCIIAHRPAHYEGLRRGKEEDAWDEWIPFMLCAIEEMALQIFEQVQKILSLREEIRARGQMKRP